MRALRLSGEWLATIGLCVSLAGCGGGSSPTAPPTPSPTPAPVVTVVSQGSGAGLAAHFVRHAVFTTATTGRIDATVDWTLSTDAVGVVVATGSFTCFDGHFINYQLCNVIASDFDSSKPKRISLPGQPAGTYTTYIDNGGPKTESVSWQVVLTTPG